MRPLKFALAAAVAVAEAAIAIALVFTSNHDDNPWLVALLAVAALFSFVTAGLVALWRRPGHPIGYLLAATGYLWFLGALGESNDSGVWTIGYVGGGISIVVFGALILAFPDGILSRRDRWIVAVGGLAGVGANLASALVDEAPARSCPKCPNSAIALTNEPRLANAIATLSTVVVAAVLIAVVASLRDRWKRASHARRRVLWPVFSSCGISVALLLTTVIVDRLHSRSYSVTWVLFLISFAVVPLAFLAGVLRSRFDRGSAARLLLSIEQGTDVVDAIGAALGDRSIEIAYPLAKGDIWVDRDGTAVPAPRATDDRSVTLVEPGGQVVAAITHDPALDDEPELIEAVVATAGFPLLNQRLQAELRGQYTFLETVADTTPSLLITIDLEGRIVNQNRATVRASGYDDEEQLRGRPFWDILIAPSERADVIARFEAAAPDHPPAEYENTFTNVRGETLVVLWRSAPLHGPDGRIVGIVAGGLDITETHRQTAAREQERIFRNAILNNAPSLLCLIDEHGVLEPSATNVAFEETLEYLPDETGGGVFWERYVVPEEAGEVERRIRAVVAGDRMASTDTTWLTKSGRRLSVAWSCTNLPAIDGRRLLLVSGINVTERRRREVELARERDATTTVLEATPATIAVLGRDGTIRDRDVGNPRAAVNRAFREALGWRDDQLVGRAFLALVADDDAEAAAAIADAASGSSSSAIETDLLRADGTRVPFSWRASPVVDVTGRTDGLVLVSGADISERRTREREAELRVAFINAMTAAIPSYLIVTHADATIRPDGVNAAFEATFGWTADEIAGESFVGQVAPSTDSAARRLIATAASGITQGEIESRWDSRDGDSRIVAWTARPVTGMHGERLVLVAGADVTVRRIQEEEIRASRARLVQASDETRQRLERNLHDGAQQRLVALAVSLRLAENKIATDPATATSLLTAARDELSEALSDLRELARGIHPAILTDRGLRAALEALVQRATVPLELEVTERRLPPAVEAAAYYVVAEALTNVSKYASASRARVCVSESEDCVVVEVSDDGVGGASPAHGTGLRGLADRVAALDGALSVESPLGVGTCVTATIPLR